MQYSYEILKNVKNLKIKDYLIFKNLKIKKKSLVRFPATSLIKSHFSKVPQLLKTAIWKPNIQSPELGGKTHIQILVGNPILPVKSLASFYNH